MLIAECWVLSADSGLGGGCVIYPPARSALSEVRFVNAFPNLTIPNSHPLTWARWYASQPYTRRKNPALHRSQFWEQFSPVETGLGAGSPICPASHKKKPFTAMKSASVHATINKHTDSCNYTTVIKFCRGLPVCALSLCCQRLPPSLSVSHSLPPGGDPGLC